MRRALLVFITVAGLCAVVASGYFGSLDWPALNRSYARFEQLANGSADLRSIVIAEAQQNAFRTNVFADGTWLLLGAILAAIGVHGLCHLRTAGEKPTTDRV
jgi:hypothetical protein